MRNAVHGWVALAVALATTACSAQPLAPQLEAGPEPGTPVYTAAGAFDHATIAATGSATYTLDDNGDAALALSADFGIPAVPGVAVFLSNTTGLDQAVRVGPLKSNTGAQRWTLKVPRGAVWRWVVLWSEAAGVQVTEATLDPR